MHSASTIVLMRVRRAYFRLRRYSGVTPRADTVLAIGNEIYALLAIRAEAGVMMRISIDRLVDRYRKLAASQAD